MMPPQAYGMMQQQPLPYGAPVAGYTGGYGAPPLPYGGYTGMPVAPPPYGMPAPGQQYPGVPGAAAPYGGAGVMYGGQQQPQQFAPLPQHTMMVPVSAPPPALAQQQPATALSPTNPFASGGGAPPAASNPFGGPPAPSNVDAEWNTFFARGAAPNQQ